MKARWSVLVLLIACIAAPVSRAAAVSSRARGVSRQIRVALLAKAQRVAMANGDLHPHDIEAVRTTARGAERLLGEGVSSFPPPASTVYVIAMRGHFTCNACPHPRGTTIPPGTVITLEVLASTMQASGFSLGNRYPQLKRVGTPIRL